MYQIFSLSHNFFKAKKNGELENILPKNVLDESYVFFDETHIKTDINKSLNKNSFLSPDRITPVLIQNGGENFTESLFYFEIVISGYFPKCWKQNTRYTLKRLTSKLSLTQLLKIHFAFKLLG